MKQNLYIFFLIIVLILLCYLSFSKKNFTQIFEFFDNNNCPEGYIYKNGKCEQLCAGCKVSYCRNGVCGSPPNISPI